MIYIYAVGAVICFVLMLYMFVTLTRINSTEISWWSLILASLALGAAWPILLTLILLRYVASWFFRL